MRTSELMTTDVITVGPETPQGGSPQNARGWSEWSAGDRRRRLIGRFITEADLFKTEADRSVTKRAGLLRWFIHDEHFPTHERTVEDVMSTPVHPLTPDADHPVAVGATSKNPIKRLPVVENDRLSASSRRPIR